MNKSINVFTSSRAAQKMRQPLLLSCKVTKLLVAWLIYACVRHRNGLHRSISQTEAEILHMEWTFNKMEEEEEQSSGDEAPEDISRSQSQSAAQERRNLEKEAIKKQKDERKNARRKRQDKMMEQKKVKKDQMIEPKKVKKARSLERLPDEIIEILSSVDQKKDQMKEKERDIGDSDIIQLSNNKTGRLVSKRKRQNEKNSKHRPTENEIGESKITGKNRKKLKDLPRVCVLNERYKPEESKGEKGRKFLREQLYGKRIKRVDSISARSTSAIGLARPKTKF